MSVNIGAPSAPDIPTINTMGREWCKTCGIFVDDNKIAKKAHVESTRHKQGIAKSIRDLHHKNINEAKEQRKQDIKNGVKVQFTKKKEVEEVKESEEVKEPMVCLWSVVESVAKEESPKDEPTTEDNEPTESVSPVPKTIIKSTSLKKKTFAEKELRSWDISVKKAVGFDLSDDEDGAPKSTAVFKRRKIAK